VSRSAPGPSRLHLGLPSLYEAALAPTTLSMYNRNLSKFLTHTRLTLPQLLSMRSAAIDHLVSTWIQALFDSGGSLDYASQCLSGLVFHCARLRHRLPISRMCLRGWSRLRVSTSHPPFTFEVAVLFAATMAKWGFHAEAVAALLAFDCFLRVGELTSICLGNIAMPRDPRLGAAHTEMAIRLPKTKTGLNQWVSIEDTRIAELLRFFLAQQPGLRPESRVFPFSPGQFNRLIHRVSAALGLSSIPYVSHSFRHGGATSSFLSGKSVESVIFRGRWLRPESARRYLQTGRALLLTHSIPAELDQAGRDIGQELLPAFTRLMVTGPKRHRVVSARAKRVTFADQQRRAPGARRH
jgi:integrase